MRLERNGQTITFTKAGTTRLQRTQPILVRTFRAEEITIAPLFTEVICSTLQRYGSSAGILVCCQLFPQISGDEAKLLVEELLKGEVREIPT